jgi:hypothetical protein
VEDHAGQQQEVIDMVVMPKALAPQKYRVNCPAPVNDYGGQKAASRVMPEHALSLALATTALKSKFWFFAVFSGIRNQGFQQYATACSSSPKGLDHSAQRWPDS